MNHCQLIVPLSEFKSKLNDMLDRLLNEADAIVVTRHGRGLFVVQRPEIFGEQAALATEARHQLAVHEMLTNPHQ